MKLAVGQVWERTGESVVVLQVRDEAHPRGLGPGYGDSAIATPIGPHTFDATILCGALPHHGLEVWSLAERRHFVSRRAGDVLWLVDGPHPGDEE